MASAIGPRGVQPARVTWHWDEGWEKAHARVMGEDGALCGFIPERPPMMRPPLMEARCRACLERLGNAVSVFPNLYRPTSLGATQD
jgi:hypothetical protein